MRLASRTERIEPFYVMEVAKAAAELGAQVAHTDSPMLYLNIGEPDFTAPPSGRQRHRPRPPPRRTRRSP